VTSKFLPDLRPRFSGAIFLPGFDLGPSNANFVDCDILGMSNLPTEE
jgi:hypothetical protein